MNRLITTTALATLLAGIAIGATAKPLEIAGIRVGNPLDSSTWWDGAEHGTGETVVINFADPDFWMGMADPSQHSNLHGAFTNPATWGQMLKFETYANMMDIEVWKKWTDRRTYNVFFDPQTFAYFMQPGAYQHMLDFEHYSQIANPAAHVSNLNAALSNFGIQVSDVTGMLSASALFGGDETTADAGAESPINN